LSIIGGNVIVDCLDVDAAAGDHGRPRTKTLVTRASCSTQNAPMVSVLQPGAVH
jgi:hypothetical protein